MPSLLTRWRGRLTRAVGLRLAAWYAAVFVVSAAGVGVLAYDMIVSSLVRRDHDLLRVKLAEYVARYESGGVDALSDAVRAEQASGGPDSVLVRLVGANAEELLVSAPPAWQTFDRSGRDLTPPPGSDDWEAIPSVADSTIFEVVSRRLPDGTLIQVGRTTIGRERRRRLQHQLSGPSCPLVSFTGSAGGRCGTKRSSGINRSIRHREQSEAIQARVPNCGLVSLLRFARNDRQRDSFVS